MKLGEFVLVIKPNVQQPFLELSCLGWVSELSDDFIKVETPSVALTFRRQTDNQGWFIGGRTSSTEGWRMTKSPITYTRQLLATIPRPIDFFHLKSEIDSLSESELMDLEELCKRYDFMLGAQQLLDALHKRPL